MKHHTLVVPLLALAALLIIASVVMAAGDAITYRIEKWTADGGGGSSSGGVYAVMGTIGQPDAGTLSGGIYGLNGSGFWGPPVYSSYLPTILKN
jgi:hypothetical protein